MLPQFLDQLTPRTSPRTQLFTAACFWSAVGLLLIARGVALLRQESWPTVAGVGLGGLVLGLVKSRMVIDNVAGKIIARIRSRTVPTCLGGLFSLRNWMLIVLMIVLGRIMAWTPMAVEIKCAVYVLVGSGLLASSRLIWRAWKKTPDSSPRNFGHP